MNGRILIDVGDILVLAAGDGALEIHAQRALATLADELNSALSEYEVMLAHLDTADYLAFTKRDPAEGEYWRGLEEERRALAEPSEGGSGS